MVILSEKASHKISHGERNYFQTLYLTKDQNLGRRKESGLKEGHAGVSNLVITFYFLNWRGARWAILLLLFFIWWTYFIDFLVSTQYLT